MADPVNLHLIKNDFSSLIKEAAEFFGIRDVFIEKDYWITLVLKRLADSEYSNSVVFKGGTSLSKGYKLINRFSEDVDLAIINASDLTGNQLKSLIRNVEKTISVDLSEIETPGVTSKGSKFRKSVFNYPILGDNNLNQIVSNKLLIETNSFANPRPYVKLEIKSMICEFLEVSNKPYLIKKYGLQPLNLNILDKRRTLIEKIISLIRSSFSEDPMAGISEKIRHFYDIYYLLNDTDCKAYFDSEDFKKDITELIIHDRTAFNEPPGWGQKAVIQSPLIKNFDSFWNTVKATYTRELSNLAFSDIPNGKDVADTFKNVIHKLSSIKI
jgi:hypothetical protein